MSAKDEQVGGNQQNRQVGLFEHAQLFGMPDPPGNVADTPEIGFQMALDGHRHAVLEQIFLLGHQFGRQIPQALFGILGSRSDGRSCRTCAWCRP